MDQALLSPAEVMARFESLGENCEFGSAQRRVGIEPFGLFRWGSTPRSILKELLDRRFDGFAEQRNITLSVVGNEWVTTDTRYQWAMHSWADANQFDHDAILAREIKRFPYLRDRMLTLLAEGSRIFVIRGLNEPISVNDALEIQSLLLAFGPNQLLFVTEGALSLEQVVPGLFHGRVPRFADPFRNIETTDVESWLSICRKTLEEPPVLGKKRYLSAIIARSRASDYFREGTDLNRACNSLPIEELVEPLPDALVAQYDHAGLMRLRTKMADHGLSDILALSDLALCKPSLSSSVGPHSHSQDRTHDAARANSVMLPPDYGFHTNYEIEPWWMVDLGEEFLVEETVILNRKSRHERFRTFTIESSRDTNIWLTRFVKLDETEVSFDLAAPWRVRFADPFLARYVRIKLRGRGYFHLRRVQIFGRALYSSGVNRKSDFLEAGSGSPQSAT